MKNVIGIILATISIILSVISITVKVTNTTPKNEQTQSFEMYRMTVYNAEDEIIFEAEGDLEWTKTNDDKTLVVTCQTGPDSYKEASVNNWHVFTIENITGIYGDYHNKVVFHTETLSDIETTSNPT